MAKGGRAELTIDYSMFEKTLDATMRRVDRGTKKATVAALKEILAISLDKVPRDTATLADSAYFEVYGSYKNFYGIVGYGGNGDPANPKTGQTASKYMIAVHEDLSAVHPIGEAKFLENAVREYQSQFLSQVAKDISGELGI